MPRSVPPTTTGTWSFSCSREAYADGRLDREEFDTRSPEAAAARTLGQLPPPCRTARAPIRDRIPVRAGHVPSDDLHRQAVTKYDSDRREAFLGFLGPSLICLMIWFLHRVSAGSSGRAS